MRDAGGKAVVSGPGVGQVNLKAVTGQGGEGVDGFGGHHNGSGFDPVADFDGVIGVEAGGKQAFGHVRACSVSW